MTFLYSQLMPSLTHLGAAGDVTKSKYLIDMDTHLVLTGGNGWPTRGEYPRRVEV
jgi:hypothetical protein